MNAVYLKEKKGVTLVALTITIIVLAIIAGVTITAVTGEKDTIQEAKNAKTSSEEESAKEQVQAAILGCVKKDGSIDREKLNKKLGTSIDNFPYCVTINNTKIIIQEDGNIQNINSDEIMFRMKRNMNNQMKGVIIKENTTWKEYVDNNSEYGTMTEDGWIPSNDGMGKWRCTKKSTNTSCKMSDIIEENTIYEFEYLFTGGND